MTIRENSKGTLFTDEEEYIKSFQKSWQEEEERISIKQKKRKRGRPKKIIPQGITFTKGEYIIDFS
tara:strand:+ start:57 stop:254 length:198 start_codon:yes stop_codon:yes gene_type:complete